MASTTPPRGSSVDDYVTARTLLADRYAEGAPLPPGHADAFVRKICVDVINERFGDEGQPKVVVLQPENVRSEMVTEEETVVSDREP